MIAPDTPSRWQHVLPYASAFLLAPLIWFCAVKGGWYVLLIPLITWNCYTALDKVLGLNLENADPNTAESQLYWYRVLVLAWPPIQFATLFGVIWYATRAEHLGTVELIGLFFGVGVVTGTMGINYSHELMHQQSRLERAFGDWLLAMVLYSHFRSEHLLVHHRYVGTPFDPVTARYNENFHRFFIRVLRQCLISSFRAEKQRLAKKDRHWSDRSNPFYRYLALQALMLGLAFLLGGLPGLGLFVLQAFVAIWHLELVNYVEHYGLTRKYLGDGKFEHVQPRHSWNAAHKASNWLLINLQRHSDHHYKPNRRFPLLQNYTQDEAPQLPHGYAVMTTAALIPRLWRNMMNPRVRRWRYMYYPEITDWAPYNNATHPQ